MNGDFSDKGEKELYDSISYETLAKISNIFLHHTHEEKQRPKERKSKVNDRLSSLPKKHPGKYLEGNSPQST